MYYKPSNSNFNDEKKFLIEGRHAGLPLRNQKSPDYPGDWIGFRLISVGANPCVRPNFFKFVWQLLFFCVFLWLTVFFLQAERITIDEIAASVNDEIITWSDIDKAIEFYPYFRKKNQDDLSFYLTVLHDLINYRVVYLEYQNEVNLTDEDYTEVETAVIKKLGDYDKLMAFLRQYDMEWQDFKDYIKEKVVYEKVLKQKFQLQITIPFRDIENFYNEQYLPEQLSLQLKPKTLIEMAPLIEAKLRKDRTEERLGDWLKEITALYKIENKLLSAADSRTGLRFQSQKNKELV